MKPATRMFLDGKTLIVMDEAGQIVPLDDTPTRIVMALHQHHGGMSGSQLAHELGISQPAASKAARSLVDLGVLRRESLPVAMNVKVYYLAVTLVDDNAMKELQKRTPRIVFDLIRSKFGKQDKVAMTFIDDMFDYVNGLPEESRPAVVEAIMKRLTSGEGHGKDKEL